MKLGLILKFIIGSAIGSLLMHVAIQQGWVNVAPPQEASTVIQQ